MFSGNRGYALLSKYSAASIKTLNGQTPVTKACAINLALSVVPGNLDGESICPASAPAASYGYSPFYTNGGSLTYYDLTSFTVPGSVETRMGPRGSAIYLRRATEPYLRNYFNADNINGSPVIGNQVFADGRSYQYTWFGSGNSSDDGITRVVGGRWTDGNGGRAELEYGQYPGSVRPDDPTVYAPPPGPERIIDEFGRSTTATYCSSFTAGGGCTSNLLQKTLTDPRGIVRSFTYDGFRNIVRTTTRAAAGSGLTDIVTSAAYGCAPANACNKPMSVTDAGGNVTDYTYDPVHGGVLTETGPADANGVQPVKRSAYVQRYAWISNGSGGFVHASSPVWLLFDERTCRTSATQGNGCAGGAGDQVVTAYDYGPDTGSAGNNLLLRGLTVTADGQTRRTCYGYDGLGNRIWETKPRAGVGVCS